MIHFFICNWKQWCVRMLTVKYHTQNADHGMLMCDVRDTLMTAINQILHKKNTLSLKRNK